MKKRKQTAKKKKITRLKASAGREKLELDLMQEYYRPIKKPITLRLDADVLGWFKKQGPGYQTRINQALRKVVLDEKKKSKG